MGTDSDPDRQHGPSVDIWVGLVIIGRVLMITVVFLALFLAIFMGYFTFPIVVIAVVSIVYMISDVGLYMAIKKRLTRRKPDEIS